MPKLTIDGMNDLGRILDADLADTEKMIKMAVYDGAHEVFEEVKRKVQQLPTNDTDSKHRDITEKQKKGLISGLYGSRIMNERGEIYAVIGFTGYNDVKTEKHPKGQPNILVARSIESGASFMNRRPFMTQAKNAARPKALAAVQKTFDAEWAKKER